MDVAKAFTYVMEDERWINKLLIAVIVTFFSFLFFPIFFLIGYAVAITRNVRNGEEKPLPEWDDWGKLFMDGIYVFMAQIVYTLPLWLLMCIASVVTFATSGVADAVSMDAAMAIMGTTWLIIACLSFFFAIALLFITPAIIVQYVLKDDFGACFRFGEVIGIARDNVSEILIVFLATFGLSLAFSVVSTFLAIIPCIGWLIGIVLGLAMGPYTMAVSGHLYGQIAAKVGGKPYKFA
jgi:hypothetical protein